MKLKYDRTGMRFGKLTVIKRQGRVRNRPAWLCKCDCGNFHLVNTYSLKNGLCKSCGCLAKTGCKKYNRYDLSGEYGIGYFENGDYFIFDKEDYDKIKDCWWTKTKDGYAYYFAKKITVHRLVTNCPKGLEVDHINHDTLDNRKSNLRICTHQQNMMNQNIRRRNKELIKGVYYDAKQKRYIASIMTNGRKHYLGSFIDKDDAIAVRTEAEKQLFGEFADINIKEADIGTFY